MSRRLKHVAVVLIVLIAAAQFIRPHLANAPTDSARTIQAHVGTASGLVAILDRSCGDCHSNRAVGRWYTRVAPLSWLMVASVERGRKAVNFSEWAAYTPEEQRELLRASCRAVSEGKMPGPYTMFSPRARLSPGDVETICAAARQAEARASR